MHHRTRRPLYLRGWVGLVAFIAVWDVAAHRRGFPTLSADFASAVERHPWLTLAATVAVVGHLWDCWPERFDPLDRLGGLLVPQGGGMWDSKNS